MITLTREEVQQVMDAILIDIPLLPCDREVKEQAIETLRARLAEPEKAQKMSDYDRGYLHGFDDAMEKPYEQREQKPVEDWEAVAADKANEALRLREQEPVGVVRFDSKRGTMSFSSHKNILPDGEYPLYTAPQKRKWKGLTEEDFSVINQSCTTKLQAASMANAILNEKNT